MSARPIKPQDGPQMIAAQSQADIVFYGGTAGGGKSWLLSYLAARYHHVPGYVAAIVRKNITQLVGPGGIWSETEKLYPKLGGRLVMAPNPVWSFPVEKGKTGLPPKVHGKHVDNEAEYHLNVAFQGSSFAFLGVDEATQIRSEATFWFMWGRCRTDIGLRSQMVLTCNPDPDSWVRKLVDWWIDSDGYAIEERSGVVRYCFRDPETDDLRWFPSREEALEALPESERKGKTPEQIRERTPGVTFVHAKLEDNKALLEKDPGYDARLAMLPRAERARLRDGNWNARAARGDFFQRGAFKRLPDTSTLIGQRLNRGAPRLHRDAYRFVRCWDFAGTPIRGNLAPVEHAEGFVAREPGHKADWSASVLLCECKPPPGTVDVGPRYVVLDVRRYQDTPGAIRKMVKQQALIDGPHVKVALFQEPGQAGVDQLDEYKRYLRGVTSIVEVPTAAPGQRASGDTAKQRNAKPVSSAVFDGRFYYNPRTCDVEYLAQFFNELEAFPDTDKQRGDRVNDDWVDALSGAFRALTELTGCWGGAPPGAVNYDPGPVRPLNQPIESRGNPAGWRDDEGRHMPKLSDTVGFKKGGF